MEPEMQDAFIETEVNQINTEKYGKISTKDGKSIKKKRNSDEARDLTKTLEKKKDISTLEINNDKNNNDSSLQDEDVIHNESSMHAGDARKTANNKLYDSISPPKNNAQEYDSLSITSIKKNTEVKHGSSTIFPSFGTSNSRDMLKKPSEGAPVLNYTPEIVNSSDHSTSSSKSSPLDPTKTASIPLNAVNDELPVGIDHNSQDKKTYIPFISYSYYSSSKSRDQGEHNSNIKETKAEEKYKYPEEITSPNTNERDSSDKVSGKDAKFQTYSTSDRSRYDSYIYRSQSNTYRSNGACENTNFDKIIPKQKVHITRLHQREEELSFYTQEAAKWLGLIFGTDRFQYSFFSVEDEDEFNIEKSYIYYRNDDKADNRSINYNKIKIFLDRSSQNFSIPDNCKVQRFTECIHIPELNVYLNQNFPPLRRESRFIQIKLKNVSLFGSGNPLLGYIGYLFIWDDKLKRPITDVLQFKPSANGVPVFTLNNSQVAYFEINKSVDDCHIVCNLYHQLANDPGSFYAAFREKKQLDSKVKLHNHVEKLYPFLSSTQHIERILEIARNCPPNTQLVAPLRTLGCYSDSSEKSSLYRSSKNKTEFFLYGFRCIYSGDNLTVKTEYPEQNSKYFLIDFKPGVRIFDSIPLNEEPLISRTIISDIFDVEPIITLSNIRFRFRKKAKCTNVYFTLQIFTDKPSINPSTTPLYGFRMPDGRFTDKYVSHPVRSGQLCVFPDIVSFYIRDNKITERTHLVFKFIYDDKDVLYKTGVFHLFDNDSIISSGYYSTVTILPRMIKKPQDFNLKRYSNVKFHIEIPTGYFLPTQFQEMATYQVPQQIKASILEVPQDILEMHFLPFVAKLLSLISPDTISLLLEKIHLFSNNQKITSMLNNWIFNNFDSNQFKHNFLSSYSNSYDQLLLRAIEGKEKKSIIIDTFQIFSSILLVSFLQKSERYTPPALFSILKNLSNIQCILIKKDSFTSKNFNFLYGNLVFNLASFISSKDMKSVLETHLRNMLEINKEIAIKCIFEFLSIFTTTTEFTMYCMQTIKNTEIGDKLIIPFSSTLSLIFKSLHVAFVGINKENNSLATKFITRLLLPCESMPTETLEKLSIIFFPVIDMISNTFDTLSSDMKKTLIPTCLFIIGYAPRKLIKNYFNSISYTFQSKCIAFLNSLTTLCLSTLNYSYIHQKKMLSPIKNYYSGEFNELTKRVLLFLSCIIESLGETVGQVIDLLGNLVNNDFQIPENYSFLFDLQSQIIQRYNLTRVYITSLLKMIFLPSQTPRCFAIATLLLYFRKNEKTIVLSTVEVLEEFTSVILKDVQTCDIPLYRISLEALIRCADFFEDKSFYDKLESRLESAFEVCDVVQRMRNSNSSPPELCVYVFKIAEKYKSLPSMRIKWLEYIVNINVQNTCYSSAFITQLQITCLISAVLEHNMSCETEQTTTYSQDFPDSTEIIATQPIRNSYLSDKKVKLSGKDFISVPSVNSENDIDFENVSEDFRVVSSEFNADYLKRSLLQAIEYGKKAGMYSILRSVLSLATRIYASECDYKMLTRLSQDLSETYKKISRKFCHGDFQELSFYLEEKDSVPKIICADKEYLSRNMDAISGGFKDMEPLRPISIEIDNSITSNQTWDHFQTIPDIHSIKFRDIKDNIILKEYVTKESLPRYTPFSEVACEPIEIEVSLLDFVELENNKQLAMMDSLLDVFKRVFYFENERDPGFNAQKIDDDIERMFDCIRQSLSSNKRYSRTNRDYSHYDLLVKLESVGQEGKVSSQNLANMIRLRLEEIIKVFHRGAIYLSDSSLTSKLNDLTKIINSFTSHFQLNKIDDDPYVGIDDPMLEKYNYDNDA